MNKYGLEADISYFESCEELCEKSDFNRGGIMTINEIIETLELAKAEVEWNYPMDYTIAIEEAIEILEKEIPDEYIKIFTICGDEQLICPHCNSLINKEICDKYAIARCVRCGQIIEWNKQEKI